MTIKFGKSDGQSWIHDLIRKLQNFQKSAQYKVNEILLFLKVGCEIEVQRRAIFFVKVVVEVLSLINIHSSSAPSWIPLIDIFLY